MHYASKLKEENKELKDTIQKMEDEMQEMRIHLSLPKFHCPDDWIRCWEIDEFIGRLRDIVTEGINR